MSYDKFVSLYIYIKATIFSHQIPVERTFYIKKVSTERSVYVENFNQICTNQVDIDYTATYCLKNFITCQPSQQL